MQKFTVIWEYVHPAVNTCIQTQKTFVLAKTLESAKTVAAPPSVVRFVYEGHLKPVFDCYNADAVITIP
jgi:hypothetical protein